MVVYLRALIEPIHRRLHPGVSSGDLFPVIRLDQLAAEGPAAVHQLRIEVVREADQKYPGHRDLLLLLAELTHEVHDEAGHLAACDRLVALGGGDAGILYMRAGALLTCGFPVLALRAFQETLARFPQHQALFAGWSCPA